VVEDRLILLRQKCSPKNLALAIYHLWRYSQRLPRKSAYCIIISGIIYCG